MEMPFYKIIGDNINKIIGVVPFLLMLFNGIGFIICFYLFITGNKPTFLVHLIYDIAKQISDSSFISLLVLLVFYKSYNKLSWISYVSLLCMWILNTIYILSGWEVDLYYSIASLIIYAIFVILTIRVLTNAKI